MTAKPRIGGVFMRIPMRNSAYIASTPIRATQWGANALEGLLTKHFDDYPVALELDETLDGGMVAYRLAMEPREVPPSFVERIESFCHEASQLASWQAVDGVFEVQLREDLMNDERDRFFYSGPSAADVEAFAAECRTHRALECLAPGDKAARDALNALLGAPEGHVTPPMRERSAG